MMARYFVVLVMLLAVGSWASSPLISGWTVVTKDFQPYQPERPVFCWSKGPWPLWKADFEIFEKEKQRFLKVRWHELKNPEGLLSRCQKGRSPDEYDVHDFPSVANLEFTETVKSETVAKMKKETFVFGQYHAVFDFPYDGTPNGRLAVVYSKSAGLYVMNAKAQLTQVDLPALSAVVHSVNYNWKFAPDLTDEEIFKVLAFHPESRRVMEKREVIDLYFARAEFRQVVFQTLGDLRGFVWPKKVEEDLLELKNVYPLRNGNQQVIALIIEVGYWPVGLVDEVDGCSRFVIKTISQTFNPSYRFLLDECY